MRGDAKGRDVLDHCVPLCLEPPELDGPEETVNRQPHTRTATHPKDSTTTTPTRRLKYRWTRGCPVEAERAGGEEGEDVGGGGVSSVVMLGGGAALEGKFVRVNADCSAVWTQRCGQAVRRTGWRRGRSKRECVEHGSGEEKVECKRRG